MLSPAERAELVVAFEPGDDVILRSFPPATGAFPERRVGGADHFDVLRVVATDELGDAPPLPERLTAIERLPTGEGFPDRVIELGDQVVGAGTVEVWEVTNVDEDPHNLHVHDRHFQAVSVDGAPPTPELRGWKNTVYVAPGTTVRIAIHFGEHTDPELPYMFHCHR